MAFDVSKIPAGRRVTYIQIGRQYSSEATLRQAVLTLQAFERYGGRVAGYGYVEKDAEALRGARLALEQASSGREGVRADRTERSLVFNRAMTAGKQARLRARVILEGVESEFHDSGQGDVTTLSTVLGHTRAAGGDAVKLREQLEQLAQLLADKAIAAVAKTRGGPAAAAALKGAIGELKTAEAELPAGTNTTAATELMDLLDGYIVESARRARKAARAAATDLGQPDIARAFELSALYRTRRGEAGAPEPGVGTREPSPSQPPQ